MPNGKVYERGRMDGATEATLDGLAKSVDGLWDKMDDLTGLATRVKLQWAILMVMLSGHIVTLVYLLKNGRV